MARADLIRPYRRLDPLLSTSSISAATLLLFPTCFSVPDAFSHLCLVAFLRPISPSFTLSRSSFLTTMLFRASMIFVKLTPKKKERKRMKKVEKRKREDQNSRMSYLKLSNPYIVWWVCVFVWVCVYVCVGVYVYISWIKISWSRDGVKGGGERRHLYTLTPTHTHSHTHKHPLTPTAHTQPITYHTTMYMVWSYKFNICCP